MKRMRVLAIILFLLARNASSKGEFVPGHIFVSDFGEKACAGPVEQYPGDRIWEINPDTGEATLFAALDGAECGGAIGLVFTPDGTRLRVAQYFKSRILEFDSNGNYTVLYDSGDGIIAPLSPNCMTFDSKGNFYVSVFKSILKFAPGSDTPKTFVNFSVNPLVFHSGPIAFNRDGNLFYLNRGGGGEPARLLRFSAPTQAQVEMTFDDRRPFSLLGDFCGGLLASYVATSLNPTQYIAHYEDSILSAETMLYEWFELVSHGPVLALNPEQSSLYFSSSDFQIRQLDLATQAVTDLAHVPSNGEQHAGISGMAVVPDSSIRNSELPCLPKIPTASNWGLIAMILVILICAKTIYRCKIVGTVQ